MGIKVSVHGGSTVSLGHNRRDPRFTAKDGHIDKERSSLNVTFLDRSLEDVYDEAFTEAVKDYNKRERHLERKIDPPTGIGYLRRIKQDKRGKKPVYEYICQIGSKEDSIDPQLAVEILSDYWETWQENNPYLIPVGAHLHMDEETPHLHISYVPVVEFERGMRFRNSLNLAFESIMGDYSKSRSETAQVAWQREERKFLAKLCRDVYDIDVDEPKDLRSEEQVRHVPTDDYKRMKELEAELERIRKRRQKKHVTHVTEKGKGGR